ncbi:MAG: hypothetical protein H8E98_07855 [Bacteroidetes bacterium]|nr:hypothetical protein [Bacteroidota bacterium]
MMLDNPFGISKSWSISNRFQIKTNTGLKLSIIQSSKEQLYFKKSYSKHPDSTHLCLYQDLCSADPLTLFYKYFGELDFYYQLKNTNMLGIGINYTGAFNRKTKPQISGPNYFYYYNQLRGEGYI